MLSYVGRISQNNLLTLPLLFQVDLEPEGKVFVVITLTGSFTEGKGLIFGLFWLTAHLWRVLLPSVTKQCAREHLCPRRLHVVAGQRLLKQLASSEGLLLTSRAAVHLVCCCSDLGPRELIHAQPALFIWSCPSNGFFLSLVLFTCVPLEGRDQEHVEHVSDIWMAFVP